MAEKRYQVFVSSTFTDLGDERQRVLRVLLELDCIPSGMELFPASDEERWELIRRVIDDCDYYIVVIGGRYGSVDAEGISYTEREYDHAVSAGKPVLGFTHADPDAIAFGRSEQDQLARQRLDAFREKVHKRICKKWLTADDLAAAVTTSLHQLMKREPAVGWIRGNAAVPVEVRAEIAELQKRVLESEAKVASAASEAADAEATMCAGLAQGDERFSVRYQISGFQGLETRMFDRSWDELFRLIAPFLRDALADATLRGQFEAALAQDAGESPSRVTLVASDYNQVMLQLEALGLAAHNAAGKQGWSLTTAGRRKLAGALALRSTLQPGATS